MNGGSGAGPVLLGVRHHGPGSARAVRAALERCAPGAVLIEGPPEADELVPLAAHEDMRPPVALLAHAVEDPGRAAFWPLAAFSPEWVALRWALGHGVPVRFIDLPAAHSLAMADAEAGIGAEAESESDADAAVEAGRGAEGDWGAEGDRGAGAETGGAEAEAGHPPRGEALRVDPLRVLAEAAGHDDPERWWEDVVEHRGAGGHRAGDQGADALAPFAALAEAMTELRAAYGDGGHPHDAVREAHMRLKVRDARREFGDRIAVVCGAWHVPALAGRRPVTADRQLLKGLPKIRTALTWVPWTHRRLARRSGYGAGITSPGWYGHLFEAPDRPVERWLTKAARLLREEDYPVSPSHVIEAVRLAEGLAAVRGRPLPGLAELDDAVRAVMGDGSGAPSALIHDRLVVGDVLGRVPEAAPAVPLQRDLDRTRRTLRLKPESAARELVLDLRQETDAARSHLLHRLRLLDIPWGEPARSRAASTGTFRETWRLRWEPELAVRVAEAGIWGTTVLGAATAKAAADAVAATALADVTTLAERCLRAALPGALPVVMRALADRAALDTDVGHLAQALPALVRAVRYGDVRGTDAAALRAVALGLAGRIFVGLPPACAGLDADGAAAMRRHLDATHQAIALLAQATEGHPESVASGKRPLGPVPQQSPGEAPMLPHPKWPHPKSPSLVAPPPNAPLPNAPLPDAPLRERWAAVLGSLAGRDSVPGLLRGRAARLLLDGGRLPDDGAERLMAQALAPGSRPADAAGWIEGFVGGPDGGLLLVHDERLLALVDGWLTGVPDAAFADVLPLLRRTFAEYDVGARRTLGELVRRGPGGAPGHPAPGSADAAAPGFGPGLDRDRAAAVLPTLRLLLGIPQRGYDDSAPERAHVGT
ncbi:hypothetical protein ADL22_08340 [Streptomyces sp. NRRL F-4489]|uniref:DUF5682 family protein n=1 Tax=Streptomyces sp. NRRL F-4489 TaxID=1609095 RepID=UPI00074973B6|nr:DUF5682 family protein [Streptomyces sp. NRRL F-4489]KUL49590.1 hypothetical protein ADL22_08340 [Streptomyces sp. NRRL F-4489]